MVNYYIQDIFVKNFEIIGNSILNIGYNISIPDNTWLLNKNSYTFKIKPPTCGDAYILKIYLF